MNQVSIALTHFNRAEMLKQSIAQVIDDPRIHEIVISDDYSTDGSWEELNRFYAKVKNVVLHRNFVNKDCYTNKFYAVSRCSQQFVILLDSDNIIDKSYLDALWRQQTWDYNTFYTPEFARPHFDFRAFSGGVITRQTVAAFMARPHFETMLNAANYMVPKYAYCAAYDPATNPHTSDSIYIASRHLARGGSIHVVPGMQYEHRVHNGSHYKKNHHKTGDFHQAVVQALKRLK